VAATCRLKMGGRDKCGIALGDGASISSPPSRSQIDGRAGTGFGGRVDKRIETGCEGGKWA